MITTLESVDLRSKLKSNVIAGLKAVGNIPVCWTTRQAMENDIENNAFRTCDGKCCMRWNMICTTIKENPIMPRKNNHITKIEKNDPDDVFHLGIA